MPKVMQADLTKTLPVTGSGASAVAESQQQAGARLHVALQKLTLKQRHGVDQIIAAELTGDTLESLLTGPGAMCSHTTYYNAKSGWSHDPNFQEALRLAREVNWDLRLSSSVRRARETIVMAAPGAASTLVAMLATEKDGTLKNDPALVLRAADSILNRTDRTTANQMPSTSVTITADDLLAARNEVDEWEHSTFKKSS